LRPLNDNKCITEIWRCQELLCYIIDMPAAIVAALFFLVWQGPSPQQTAPEGVQREAQRNQSNSQRASSMAGGATSQNDQNKRTDQASQDRRESVNIVSTPKIHTESEKDFWDKALVVATWFLVIIGALQIIFLWRTVNATRDNAEAARLNAQAVVNSERAYLLLHKSLTPGKPHIQWEFETRVENFGKTPARIVSCAIEFQLGDGADEPPDPSIFERQTPFPAMFLPQGEKITKPFDPAPWQNAELSSGKKHLWICGAIRYQNVLEREPAATHETLFCRCYLPLQKPMGWYQGPDQYNRAT
jgi:hypothetical protein